MSDREDRQESMTIMPLGGGQEVGRSCLLLKYRGRTVLLDCGNHPGREGMDAHPFFDAVEAEEVDLILITHFHIDHCAALPYFTEKTNFKGRIFMTHATKAVMQLMISDFVRLGGGNKATSSLYDDKDFRSCMDKIEVIDYHSTIEHKGIKFCGYVAGHVLGAAMFTISIDGVNVLYTGDYSMEEDRHLMPAEVPPDRPDVLIVESTYGVTNHSSREEREARFTSTVEAIVRRKGNCLIPVFALGRAQELLLILDEYWKSNPDLQDIPIYYASKMATKALRVYQTFVNMMNSHIQSLMDVRNPFRFSHISNLKGTDNSMQLMAPCVVMAAPGMLQNGESRRLFENWCDDDRNGVVLAGYSVEGTLAKRLLSDPDEITCLNGRIKKRVCSIEYVSFSAHVDYIQNSQFIRSVVPDNIVLVHGERNEMSRLKAALDRDIEQSWPDKNHVPSVVMPDNCVTVTLTFDKPIIADVVGSVAKQALSDVTNFEEGTVEYSEIPDNVVVVTENFQSKMVAIDEINSQTSCRVGCIEQHLVVPLPAEILQLRKYNKINVMRLLLPHLSEVFDDVVVDKKSHSLSEGDQALNTKVCIQNAIVIEEDDDDKMVVTWSASPINDLVADCAAGLLFQVLSATHFLRACWLSASKVNTSPCDGHEQSDQSQSNKRAKTIGVSADEETIVKRMKMGLVDPSRAFVRENKVEGLIYEDADPDVVARNKPRLEKIRRYLENYENGMFESVAMSHNGLRLIIQAKDQTQKNTEEVCEGYCYLHWVDNKESHHGHSHAHHSIPATCHAVVQSSSAWLRDAVSSALRHVDDQL